MFKIVIKLVRLVNFQIYQLSQLFGYFYYLLMDVSKSSNLNLFELVMNVSKKLILNLLWMSYRYVNCAIPLEKVDLGLFAEISLLLTTLKNNNSVRPLVSGGRFRLGFL